MYTWEIEQLLREKNNILYNDEYIKMILESPQIKHIRYDNKYDFFETTTIEDDNTSHYFKYKVIKRTKKAH